MSEWIAKLFYKPAFVCTGTQLSVVLTGDDVALFYKAGGSLFTISLAKRYSHNGTK